MQSRQIIEELLASAGIPVNGSEPWSLVVHDERFYDRVLSSPSLGLGESYMDGWWDSEDLVELFYRLLSSDVTNRVSFGLREALAVLRTRLLNLQSRARARKVIDEHYEPGAYDSSSVEMWQAMLGRTMAYTCGYWLDAQDLDAAQEAKLDLICRKLYLDKHHRVLDLGCGWGTFARYAGERIGCQIDAVNLAGRQIEFARTFCKDLPVALYACDYRQTEVYNPEGRPYDRVVALGLAEHIGPKNHRAFFRLARDLLVERGLLFMHQIGYNISRTRCDPWFDKYIFPGGVPPSVVQLSRAMEGLFTLEDWHNLGPDYHPTLDSWWANLDAYASAKEGSLTPRFYRMWRYYLQSVSGGFKSRRALQLHQLILSKDGYLGYRSVR